MKPISDTRDEDYIDSFIERGHMTDPVPVTLPTVSWGHPDATRRVLLIHGLSATANTWWRVGDELGRRGCQVVAPDLRGHGAAPRTLTYTLAEHAADLGALGTGWDVMVGHSLGAAIAATAAQRQGFASCLVLLDPVLEIDDASLPALIEDQLGELDPLADPGAIHAAHPTWHAEDAFQKAVGARTTSATTVERCLLDNRPWSYLGLLSDPDLPATLVLGGDPAVGTLFPPSLAAHDSVSPSVTYRMCEGIGHSIHREVPEAVVEAVLEMLG